MSKVNTPKYSILTVVGGARLLPSVSFAEATGVAVERAGGERLATAVGHFARSRSLLNAALQAFDEGNKLVDPSALIDTTEWRDSLVDRAEDLGRVLDPQPRANRSGVAFSPDTRLLGTFSEAPASENEIR